MKIRQENFHCDYCGLQFDHKNGFGLHMKLEHKVILEKNPVIKEPETDESVQDETKFKTRDQASSIQSQTKAFQFEICEKSFYYQSRMKHHIALVHEEKRPHKCEMCHKRFYQKGRLKKHLAFVHEDRKLFKCKVCSSIHRFFG